LKEERWHVTSFLISCSCGREESGRGREKRQEKNMNGSGFHFPNPRHHNTRNFNPAAFPAILGLRGLRGGKWDDDGMVMGGLGFFLAFSARCLLRGQKKMSVRLGKHNSFLAGCQSVISWQQWNVAAVTASGSCGRGWGCAVLPRVTVR